MENDSLSKGEQTRLQIIETAYTLFVNQGYHGTSMREIAAEAGIALGGIYNHFATKEEIFNAVFSAHHPILQIIPAIRKAEGDTPEELMKDVARLLVEGLKNQPNFLSLLMVDIVEFQCRYSSSLISSEIVFISDFYQRLMLHAGKRLRPIPPLIIARSFFGLFFSYFMTDTVLNTIADAPVEIKENAFNYFVEIYLNGILSADPDAGDGESK